VKSIADGPEIITLAEGSRLCPSVVGFTKNGERLVGQLARRQAVINPENTVFSIKRFVGRRFDEVDAEKKIVPYKVRSGSNGMAVADVGGQQFTPEAISAMVLAKLKKDAEAFLGEDVKDVVITVPAYFNDSQRNATKIAGEIAGFNVLRILNEPTAAAIAYGVDKQDTVKTILVWDLGGGTFDVTILQMGGGVLEVLATNGDPHLGGDDWDEALVQYLADEFQKEQGADPRKDSQALQRMREASEKAKMELSSMGQTDINLPFLLSDAGGPKHVNTTLTRSRFEELTKGLMERCTAPYKNALKDAGLDASKIDEVVLVGGSTRMPMVQELIVKLTGKEPRKGVNPDEAVAAGAAIQAAVQTGTQPGLVLVDVTPLSLGVETQGGVMNVMIPRNTRIPCEVTESGYTTAADFQSSVSVKVLQGERPMARDNRVLGTFELGGIPPAPKHVPQIEIKFDVDKDGILHVSARDTASGKAQTVTITGSTTLSKGDIDRIMKDAASHASEDENRRAAIDMRNNGEKLIFQCDEMLKGYGDKIDGDVKSRLESAVQAMRSLLTSDDAGKMKTAFTELEEASRAAGEAIYRSGQAENQPPDQEGEAEGSEE
jgi:molecular chaperone DnaK